MLTIDFALPISRLTMRLQSAVNSFNEAKKSNSAFSDWARRNLYPHKIPGYEAAVISLKAPKIAPGDATDEQMDFYSRFVRSI